MIEKYWIFRNLILKIFLSHMTFLIVESVCCLSCVKPEKPVYYPSFAHHFSVFPCGNFWGKPKIPLFSLFAEFWMVYSPFFWDVFQWIFTPFPHWNCFCHMKNLLLPQGFFQVFPFCTYTTASTTTYNNHYIILSIRQRT